MEASKFPEKEIPLPRTPYERAWRAVINLEEAIHRQEPERIHGGDERVVIIRQTEEVVTETHFEYVQLAEGLVPQVSQKMYFRSGGDSHQVYRLEHGSARDPSPGVPNPREMEEQRMQAFSDMVKTVLGIIVDPPTDWIVKIEPPLADEV